MRWWLRLQMGWGLCGQAINMVMLSSALAPTIGKFFGCRAIYPALLLPPMIVLFLLTIGYLMDKWHWMQRQDAQHRMRSGTWQELFDRLDKLERLLSDRAVGTK